MVAEIYAYLSSCLGHWIDGYWIATIVPEAGNLIAPRASGRFADWLDGHWSREVRHRVLVGIALIGVFAAGFQAWSDGHQIIRDLEKQIANLQGENRQLRSAASSDAVTIQRLQTDLAERSKVRAQEKTASQPNKYVCVSDIAPLPPSKAKYAVLVEFGVRRNSTNGALAGVRTDQEYSKASRWTASPLRTDCPKGTFVFFNSFQNRSNRHVYAVRFSDPSLTPERSLYLYLEGNKPLIVQKVQFVEDYAARNDQTRVRQLLAEPLATCPRK